VRPLKNLLIKIYIKQALNFSINTLTLSKRSRQILMTNPYNKSRGVIYPSAFVLALAKG
jgi:hypothetical protein